MKVAQSRLTLPHHGLYSPWNSPGQTTGMGSHSLLQGIFLTKDQTWVSCIAGGFFSLSCQGSQSTSDVVGETTSESASIVFSYDLLSTYGTKFSSTVQSAVQKTEQFPFPRLKLLDSVHSNPSDDSFYFLPLHQLSWSPTSLYIHKHLCNALIYGCLRTGRIVKSLIFWQWVSFNKATCQTALFFS